MNHETVPRDFKSQKSSAGAYLLKNYLAVLSLKLFSTEEKRIILEQFPFNQKTDYLSLVSITRQMLRPRHKNKAIMRLSSHPSR